MAVSASLTTMLRGWNNFDSLKYYDIEDDATIDDIKDDGTIDDIEDDGAIDDIEEVIKLAILDNT